MHVPHPCVQTCVPAQQQRHWPGACTGASQQHADPTESRGSWLRQACCRSPRPKALDCPGLPSFSPQAGKSCPFYLQNLFGIGNFTCPIWPHAVVASLAFLFLP